MSELLPTLQADSIRNGLLDYLVTTFALTDGAARESLDEFLADPVSGMFKGPYARLRMPFRPAADGWRDTLEWYEGFTPYGHQAAAFARLASAAQGKSRRPQPTLVTTGTGSGKTEAFLYPILDHVVRAKREGITGMKALILYPMNALANDQALRLAKMIKEYPALGGVRAALYTGQDGPQRTIVTEEGLITDRSIIRDSAPDILLTNYKMLDQLLLRRDDQDIWRQSATSLQYLVLDEFHTYDGAQGTDVAMLLRRLGLALKSYWPADDPSIDEADRARPLGKITPVATSATLGDKGDPTTMVEFARTVFGEEFDADAIITESRLSLDEWSAGALERIEAIGLTPIPISSINMRAANAAVADLGPDPSASAVAGTMVRFLIDGPDEVINALTASTDDDTCATMLDVTRALPLVQAMAAVATDALPLEDFAAAVVGEGRTALALATGGAEWSLFFTNVIALLGHVRALAGRSALSVDVHLWVRELTRIDRAADSSTTFRWGDDGPPLAGVDIDEVRPSFPAIYCRHCGRSGWGIGLAPVGLDLAGDDESIRRNHAAREGRFRALIYAPGEAERSKSAYEQPIDGLVWFSVRERALLADAADEESPDVKDGWVLPVLTTTGPDADALARDDVCPSCAQADGIRFLGSAIATLISVSLSTLFGSAELDQAEKKALVFTDSVQDAAHRAGFVQARSHTLTLRAVLREAVNNGPLPLDQLVDQVIATAGDNRFARYRIIAPECADRETFVEFWNVPTLKEVSAKVKKRVARRLAFDAAMEFGLNSRLGRTLELTGAVAVEVGASPERMTRAARTALKDFALQGNLGDDANAGPDLRMILQWVRGVLERMRSQGAIDHPWFVTYREEDGNRFSIWGGRPQREGMPAFPRGRSAPAYPRIGGTNEKGRESDLDPVTHVKSWYSRWTSRVLDVSPADAGLLVKLLLQRLAADDLLIRTISKSGAEIFAIPASAVVVAPVESDALIAGEHMLACTVCRALTPGTLTAISQLDNAPCFTVRCTGRLTPISVVDGFYRRLYTSPDMRRVVAREHTGLLDDITRLSYENGFKGANDDPQAPNVLVATPTLELGIDIGDLSTVFLASLPKTVASYLQRVGRAGRLTGNALNLAYVTGRGDLLPKIGDPLSVINGEVRPPATYLEAAEILRRQYTAHLVDTLARDSGRPHPKKAAAAIGSSEPGTFLGDLIEFAESDVEAHLARFVGALDGVGASAIESLRQWVTPHDGSGTSDFAAHLHKASGAWQHNVATLEHRVQSIESILPELEARRVSPAKTDDDDRAWRSAVIALKLTRGQIAHLKGEYWIGVLEEYGVLPNYTLLDDSVTLDVGLSWIDPDSKTFHSEHAQFQRASAQAIREFAPGATFYARGWEISIDAVDIGMGAEAIRPWAFCPACGFGVDVELNGVITQIEQCPRCGSAGIADVGQRIDVIELTNASAEIRRDDAMISDRRDQRETAYFQMFVAADIDPQHIGSQWFVEQTSFGATYLRTMDLRWINAGLPGHGGRRAIAGDERSAALFRLCAGCGKLDTDTGHNKRYEHRPWCQYREALDENTRDAALTRTLRTQGLMLRLPNSVTVGDDFALPSLSAAILLGLREQLGGHPDHISIENSVDPTFSDGSQNHAGLLLHDIVPGGTGYLAELSGPAEFKSLLLTAWEHVRDCECQYEMRQACHRCLLPFVGPQQVKYVSRAAAERHLRTLIGLPIDAAEAADAPEWIITEIPPDDTNPESHLEQRFRKVFIERLRVLGASIKEIPGAWGNTVQFTLPDSPRHWTLTPQVHLENSKPDFVLQCNDVEVPTMAIFTDGHRFHATANNNRIADDAEKRAILRDTGRFVLAITAKDVADAETNESSAPGWFNESAIGQVMTNPKLMASPAAYQSLGDGPITFLMNWVTAPSRKDVSTVARAVPYFIASNVAHTTQLNGAPTTMTLADLAYARITGKEIESAEIGRLVNIWHKGPLAVAVDWNSAGINVAVVLDDHEASFDAAHADAWRDWLRISNALALRDWPTVITTTSLISKAAAGAGQGQGSPASTTSNPLVNEAPSAWPAPWRDAHAIAMSDLEREIIAALAMRPNLVAPVMGEEGPDGMPIEIAWPEQRVAVHVPTMTSDDISDLVAAGWQVVEPDPDLIEAALKGSAPTHILS